jgi:hypothetical protein
MNCKESPLTKRDKWIIAGSIALLFFLLSCPLTYIFMQKLLGFTTLKFSYDYGCPTFLGLIVHSLLFLAIVKIIMR